MIILGEWTGISFTTSTFQPERVTIIAIKIIFTSKEAFATSLQTTGKNITATFEVTVLWAVAIGDMVCAN